MTDTPEPPIPLTGVLQDHNDDCVSACVASLFGLPLDAVPRFQPETWGDELDLWLGERGYGFINVAFTGEQKDRIPRGYTIGAVPSKSHGDDGWMHSVICLDGRIVWDPKAGSQPGTERAREYTVIYPLRPGQDHPTPDPAKNVNHYDMALAHDFPDGTSLYVTKNEAGGDSYYSDEVGCGVLVWDTALVSPRTLEAALAHHGGRPTPDPDVSGNHAPPASWQTDDGRPIFGPGSPHGISEHLASRQPAEQPNFLRALIACDVLIRNMRHYGARWHDEGIVQAVLAENTRVVQAISAKREAGTPEPSIMGERANLVSAAGDAGNNQEAGSRQAQHSGGNTGSPASDHQPADHQAGLVTLIQNAQTGYLLGDEGTAVHDADVLSDAEAVAILAALGPYLRPMREPVNRWRLAEWLHDFEADVDAHGVILHPWSERPQRVHDAYYSVAEECLETMTNEKRKRGPDD